MGKKFLLAAAQGGHFRIELVHLGLEIGDVLGILFGAVNPASERDATRETHRLATECGELLLLSQDVRFASLELIMPAGLGRVLIVNIVEMALTFHDPALIAGITRGHVAKETACARIISGFTGGQESEEESG